MRRKQQHALELPYALKAADLPGPITRTYEAKVYPVRSAEMCHHESYNRLSHFG
jgi:hypothetical protein